MCLEPIQRSHRYQHKGVWIDFSIQVDWERDRILYRASVELPNEGGVIYSDFYESRAEAEFAAEELINSWN